MVDFAEHKRALLCNDPQSAADYRDAMAEAVEAVAAWLQSDKMYTGGSIRELRSAIRFQPSSDGLGMRPALQRLIGLFLEKSLKVHHPHSLAHLHCPTLVASQVAEVLINAANQSMDSWDQSPAGSLMEVQMIGWLRGKAPVNQAVLRLYADAWRKPSVRWRIGAASHSIWLSTLLGMLVSVLLLLLVRQYTFNWESTLLTNAASVKVIDILSWLPAKFGFPAPDAGAVLKGRLNSSTADARVWSGLLVGSIVCYGILPRLGAWLACKILLARNSERLPLDKPYYQKIIRRWQTEIVDADNRSESVHTVSPKISISGAPKWAVMLETEWHDAAWHVHTLGQEWLDKGTADSRDAVAALIAELQRQPAQLLIGRRAPPAPDRGVLRQIVRLAEAAQGGAVVQLLLENNVSDGLKNHLTQWHDALAERGLAWLDPPRISQERRMAEQKAV